MSTDPRSSQQNEIQPEPNRSTKHIQSPPPSKDDEQNNNNNNAGGEAAQNSGKAPFINCPKRISRWRKLWSNPKFKEMVKVKAPPHPNPPAPPASVKAESLIQLIKSDLNHIKDEATKLQKYKDQLSHEHGKLQTRFNELQNYKGDEKEKPLMDFRKNLMKVKLAIPSKYIIAAEKDERSKYSRFITEEAERQDKSDKIPELLKSKSFEAINEFKDFESRYTELDERERLCLLCFSIFPQDAIIKKRLMLQWWATEGFARNEKEASNIFERVMAKGFIEPVNKKRSPSTGSCRVHPFHHSALVALARREKLFNFKSGGDPTQNFSGCFQACLMGEGLISHEDFNRRYGDGDGEREPSKVITELIQELEKIHLLLNVDEHILEFIEDWFAKMKNLNILYLGRWKASATHHIEVEDPKFLKKVGDLKYVKFLSLQGVSNIISLPDSVLDLTHLDILDLRTCSNLERIPEKIGFLQSLTHLDMSECYLLAHMPKSLSSLKKLKVLKGFFVTDEHSSSRTRKGCTLADLEGLKSLEKLCIYTDWKSFPAERDVLDLEKLKSVTKLTITWGVGRTEERSPPPTAAPAGRLPPKLEKLDLKCFPKPASAEWLKPKNLVGLEKLYIRGGKFSDLGQFQRIDGEENEKWTVKVVRLKCLSEIEMEWKQLQELFPEMEYLEKVSCPKLTMFPCDAKGVWIKHQ